MFTTTWPLAWWMSTQDKEHHPEGVEEMTTVVKDVIAHTGTIFTVDLLIVMAVVMAVTVMVVMVVEMVAIVATAIVEI